MNKKKKNDEELARQRFEEQKKRHEEQAERLRKAKSERQGNVRSYIFDKRLCDITYVTPVLPVAFEILAQQAM